MPVSPKSGGRAIWDALMNILAQPDGLAPYHPPPAGAGTRVPRVVVTVGGGGFGAQALSLVRAMGHRWRYVYLLGDLPERR